MKDLEKSISAERGATMVEYALMVALIAIALIASLNSLKEDISGTFSYVGSQLDSAHGAE